MPGISSPGREVSDMCCAYCCGKWLRCSHGKYHTGCTSIGLFATVKQNGQVQVFDTKSILQKGLRMARQLLQ